MERLRAELLAVIEDAEQSGDLVGHVKTWLRWAEGRIDETATFALAPDERRQAAVGLAIRRGRVTSGQLASVAGVCRESARLTLTAMAEDGLLTARGSRRGRHYLPSNDLGKVAQGGTG